MEDNKKNIGLLIPYLTDGGAERTVANLSKDLSERYNVYILLFNADRVTYPHAGKIIDLNFKYGESKIGRLYQIFNHAHIVSKYRKDLKLDVIISFMTTANIYNGLTATQKSHAILSIRNTMAQEAQNFAIKKLLKIANSKADKIVALSKGVEEELKTMFSYNENKTCTIYNSCSIDWLTRQSREIDEMILKTDFTKPVICTVGRLHHQKGHWHLFRAMKEVVKVHPDCQLYVFGQGKYLKEFETYVDKLGVAGNIHFVGFVNNHHKFIQKSKAFIFPSLYEGLGNVLLEALACGTPAISTDCNFGPKEILNDDFTVKINNIYYADYGILIPPFTMEAFDGSVLEPDDKDMILAKAIIELLSNKERQEHYKAKALGRIKDFAPEKIKRNWIELIESICIKEK